MRQTRPECRNGQTQLRRKSRKCNSGKHHVVDDLTKPSKRKNLKSETSMEIRSLRLRAKVKTKTKTIRLPTEAKLENDSRLQKSLTAFSKATGKLEKEDEKNRPSVVNHCLVMSDCDSHRSQEHFRKVFAKSFATHRNKSERSEWMNAVEHVIDDQFTELR